MWTTLQKTLLALIIMCASYLVHRITGVSTELCSLKNCSCHSYSLALLYVILKLRKAFCLLGHE